MQLIALIDILLCRKRSPKTEADGFKFPTQIKPVLADSPDASARRNIIVPITGGGSGGGSDSKGSVTPVVIPPPGATSTPTPDTEEVMKLQAQALSIKIEQPEPPILNVKEEFEFVEPKAVRIVRSYLSAPTILFKFILFFTSFFSTSFSTLLKKSSEYKMLHMLSAGQTVASS